MVVSRCCVSCFAKGLASPIVDVGMVRGPVANNPQDQEMTMKTTLFLSAVAGCVIAASTAIAQQGGANWAQSYGDATVQSVPAPRYVAAVDRFTGSDLGYAGKVTRHHWTRP
jgi:hypothetical protein